MWPNLRVWETAVRAHASSMVHGLTARPRRRLSGRSSARSAQEYLTLLPKATFRTPTPSFLATRRLRGPKAPG